MPHTDPDGWWKGGKISHGNDPGVAVRINPWGVLYRTFGNPPDADTRIEVGNLLLYVLYEGQTDWTLVTARKRVDGSLYESSFKFINGEQIKQPANYYSDTPAQIVTDLPLSNYAYHFYATRVPIAGTISGICVSFDARLLTGREGTVLAQTGCDFKSSDGSYIRESWAGSMRPVRRKSQRFYGSTMSLAQLMANPPPNIL